MANTYPVILPVNKVGANTPPIPPAPKVNEVATILNNIRPTKSPITTQMSSATKLKILLETISFIFPFKILLMVLKPSPNRGGTKYTIIPNKIPPINKRL